MADSESWLERLDLPWPSYEKAHYGDAEEAVYAEVIDILRRDGVPFLLAGAFALNVYTGIWRSTKDLDFFLRPGDLDAAYAALERAGCDVEVVDAVWLSKAWKHGVFVDLIHANANGLMPVDDSWYAHARTTKLLGREVLVAPIEEVILSKMFVASRERFDGADVLHLIHAARGWLDWGRLLAKAGPHAGLLLGHFHHFQYAYPAFAHYVPPEVMDRAERQAAEARLEDCFRGRLLDPIQFAVDVDVLKLPDERARVRAEAARALDVQARARRATTAAREPRRDRPRPPSRPGGQEAGK